MLCDTPTLARHVQELIVYPDYVSPGRPCKYEMGSGMCTGASFLVLKAAISMDALKGFEWHAFWGSPIDAMWWNLRRCCRNLQKIHVDFTERLPSPNSAIFMFNNLTSFSMTTKPIYYLRRNDLGDRVPESLAIYNKLWDMLIQRCPDLESLSIQSDLDRPVYCHRLLDGCWPSLRSLALGPIKFDVFGITSLQELNTFLEAHSSLERITFRNVPIDLSALPKEALPSLKHLNGSIDHFRALSARGLPPQNIQFGLNNPQTHFPHSPLSESLHSLTLGEVIPLRELTPLSVSSMLSGLHALTSLTAVFSLESGYDSNGVFRTIVSSCPQMLHLDLTCTSKPSFYLEAFSRTLRGLTRLRTLSLTVVKVPGDESMQAGATRIALSNPRLRRFTIAYIPIAPLYRDRAFVRPDPIHEGRFTVLCDAHGIPVKLFSFERWKRWGWLGKRVRRRDILDLRPSGHPDVAKTGWRQLLFERSPAGEEARLLMLSTWLLGLAAWGIAKSVLGKAIEAPWRTGGLDKLSITAS
ncbi:hypothetical protein BDY19DRAFT_921700 [Irpex rosettiformis]|uniref:Uncharacterized protein n=1 Tax=Irpex rosettiformis TaxID=378272 RepID=A0ACB8UFB2_9APHY|nr:hypothetical protein BDY19DRAFT_921700 [Irpex rosettiformis]